MSGTITGNCGVFGRDALLGSLGVGCMSIADMMLCCQGGRRWRDFKGQEQRGNFRHLLARHQRSTLPYKTTFSPLSSNIISTVLNLCYIPVNHLMPSPQPEKPSLQAITVPSPTGSALMQDNPIA